MSEPPAGAAGSALRTTLLAGGILLVVDAALLLLQSVVLPAVGSVPMLPWAALLVSSAALVIVALGLGRAGSLVARRPLGVAALLALAAWPLVERLVQALVAFTMESVAFWQAWGWISLAVQLSAALAAALEIARAGVIRGALRWAPLWAVVALAAPQVVALLALAAPGADSQGLAGPLVGLSQLTTIGVPLTLGILAILRARSLPPPAPVQVYPPTP